MSKFRVRVAAFLFMAFFLGCGDTGGGDSSDSGGGGGGSGSAGPTPPHGDRGSCSDCHGNSYCTQSSADQLSIVSSASACPTPPHGDRGTCSNCHTDYCTAACSINRDCNDKNSCTADTCRNPGQTNAVCVNTLKCVPGSACCDASGCLAPDGSACAIGFCYSGSCQADSSCAYSLTSPKGGEKWKAGSRHPITWTTLGAGCSGYVILKYSTTGPNGPWKPIANNLIDSGQKSWRVPNTPTGKARVKVMDYAAPDTIYGLSDNNFRIVPR